MTDSKETVALKNTDFDWICEVKLDIRLMSCSCLKKKET